MKIHEKYIQRCIELARNGLGTTYPNPMVGSVVVVDNKILGEGWHKKAGEAHAEVLAIEKVADKSLLKKASLYVSLEPCSHYGKTPPCSNLIIESGIKKVIIGCVDPFSKVAGKGIKRLMDAGCEVTLGVLEEECLNLNKRFLCFHTQSRPYIILKWAESEDGFLAPSEGQQKERKPIWITNAYSRQLVHKWRTQEQAILVGTTTALKDNPRLDVRNWKGTSPVRLLIDRNLKVPPSSHLYNQKVRTIIFCEVTPPENKENIEYVQLNFSDSVAHRVVETVASLNLQSLIVEGGAGTLVSFIEEKLWDEARVFKSDISFGAGTPAPRLSGVLLEKQKIFGDELKIYNRD